MARVVAVDVPHHVTQRGNARQFVLESDPDRRVYLQLLERYCRLHRVSLLGYCLMSNHVHLIAIPRQPDSLPLALKHTHGQYAAYFNASHASSGHVWQGRYYSCPLDTPRLWTALRYTEVNPIRAGVAAAPEAHIWSSAAVHCGYADPGLLLELTLWNQTWTACAWREYLNVSGPEAVADADAIRKSTHTGRPLGAPDFVRGLESALRRRLGCERGGRPRRLETDPKQAAFALVRY
jgi:putative transposase